MDFLGYKMGKQSRPLKFSLLFQNISQLQIAYPIPAAQPAAAQSQPGAVLSILREKSHIFMRGVWAAQEGQDLFLTYTHCALNQLPK